MRDIVKEMEKYLKPNIYYKPSTKVRFGNLKLDDMFYIDTTLYRKTTPFQFTNSKGEAIAVTVTIKKKSFIIDDDYKVFTAEDYTPKKYRNDFLKLE